MLPPPAVIRGPRQDAERDAGPVVASLGTEQGAVPAVVLEDEEAK
jgi:hypothetical protein